jgi:hypothetical protein
MKKSERRVFGIVWAVAIVALLLTSMPGPLRAQENITDEEMDEQMQEYIEEAKKYSKELADFFDEKGTDWRFWDGDHDRTNPDPSTGHIIEISRPQLRAVLNSIQNAPNPQEKTKRERKYKYQYVLNLLHEAGHRKALRTGTGYKNLEDVEEVRNMAELNNRLIDILHELNKIISGQKPGPGDGDRLYSNLGPKEAAALFDEVKKMIERQREYCQNRGYWDRIAKAFWINRVIEAWENEVNNTVRTLRKTGASDKQIAEYINGKIKSNFEKSNPKYTTFKLIKKNLKLNIEIILKVDETTLAPIVEVRINGKLINRPIPPRAVANRPRRTGRVEDRGKTNIFKSICFGLGFKTGGGLWGLEDFKNSHTYIENLYRDSSVYTASTSGFGGSFSGQLELFARYIMPNAHELGLGTGFQYLPGGTFRQELTSEESTTTIEYGLSVFSIPVEVFYKVPIKIKKQPLFLTFTGGLDFRKATLNYDYTYISSKGGAENSYLRGKLRDSGFGGHVSAGLEYPLKKNLHLTLDAGYSFGKLDEFKGTVSDEQGAQGEVILGKKGENGGYVIPFYYSGSVCPHFNPAVVNLGGPAISVGIRYFLGHAGDFPGGNGPEPPPDPAETDGADEKGREKDKEKEKPPWEADGTKDGEWGKEPPGIPWLDCLVLPEQDLECMKLFRIWSHYEENGELKDENARQKWYLKAYQIVDQELGKACADYCKEVRKIDPECYYTHYRLVYLIWLYLPNFSRIVGVAECECQHGV